MSDQITEGFLTRINSRNRSAKGQVKHSGWVQENTTIEGKPFSFHEHEMQQEIFDDPASRIAVKKCSQVGLSELQVRKLLTIAAVERYVRVIYTLPTRQFAMRFSKDRVDSVISQSEALADMIKKGANSTEQKVFVNSNVIYISGTFGDVSAISIPATYVVNDELDFSNLEVVGKMASRLRHAPMNPDGHRGYHHKFSTPTLPEYGVSEAFNLGTQAYYFVKCSKCNHAFAPNWYKDFIIPGYDGGIEELDSQLVKPLLDRKLHDRAFLRCEKCGHDLKHDLLDSSRREWVRKHPDRDSSSYQISPWDVPAYNNPRSILMQLPEYKRLMDFYNFVLGLEYEDADATFLKTIFENCRKAEWWQYETVARSIQTVAGMDVGKVCHFTLLYRVGTIIYVPYAEEIQHTQAKPAKERIKDRLKFYNTKVFCMDAGPDITLVRELTENCPAFGCKAYAVEYVKKVGLKDFEVMDDEPIVKANRTEMFKILMKEHNTEQIQYASPTVAPVMDQFATQVTSIKKITREDDQGDEVEQIVKTGADHFGHSLNYARIALALAEGGLVTNVVGILPGITGVAMRGYDDEENDRDLVSPFTGYI